MLQRTLPSSPRYHLAFRVTGLFVWVFLSLPAFDSSTRKGEALSSGPWIAWLMLFFSFAPAFWISSSAKMLAPWLRVLALAVQTGCVLGMTAIFQGYLVGFLLVIVCWQIGLWLPLQATIVWAFAESCLWIFFQEPHYHLGWRWSATGAVLGFQAFAIITATIARSEAEARQDQASINAELVSTRELVRETSKAGERIRIAHELHDVMGHSLTALCLHLEAALHLSGVQREETLRKARLVAQQLLDDVRAVVAGLHEDDSIDLRQALELLQQNIPRIRLAIEIPDRLALTDGARAHAVLRCIQEITTNTLKHSDAKNLWIQIYLRESAIEIEAHDDGSKASQGRPGKGISIMQRRLEELGGGLTLGSASHSGFYWKAWLPAGNTR